MLFFRLGRMPRWAIGTLAILVMTPMALLGGLSATLHTPFSWGLRVLGGFSAGVLTYVAIRTMARTPATRRWATRVSIGTGLAIVGFLCWGASAGPGDRGAVVLVLFPGLIGAIASADGPSSRFLSSRPAVYGGRISYSLYLVHIPLFEILWTAILFFPALAPDSPAALLAAGLALVGALGAAHLLYRFVEEPARRRLRDLAGAAPGRRRVAPQAERHIAAGSSYGRQLEGLAAR